MHHALKTLLSVALSPFHVCLFGMPNPDFTANNPLRMPSRPSTMMSSSIHRPGCIFERIASWALMLMDWITCTKTLATVSTVVRCFTSHFSLKQQIKNRAQRWESGVNQIQTLNGGPSCQPNTDQTRRRLDTPQIALLRCGDVRAAIFALFQQSLSPVTVGDGVWQIGEGDAVNLTAVSETSTRLPVIKHETAERPGRGRDWQADGRAAHLEMEAEIPGRPLQQISRLCRAQLRPKVAVFFNSDASLKLERLTWIHSSSMWVLQPPL